MGRVRLVLVLLCLAALLGAAGCGSSGDQVATIGTSEVTIEEGTPTDTFLERDKAILAKQPYLPWYQQCIEGQMTKAITPALEEELADAPRSEVELKLSRLIIPAGEACDVPGKAFIDPKASEAELALLRSSQQQGAGLLLRTNGFPPHLVSCIERELGALPGKQLVALIEADEHRREVIFTELAKGCE
jgi:hypothetical protein